MHQLAVFDSITFLAVFVRNMHENEDVSTFWENFKWLKMYQS